MFISLSSSILTSRLCVCIVGGMQLANTPYVSLSGPLGEGLLYPLFQLGEDMSTWHSELLELEALGEGGEGINFGDVGNGAAFDMACSEGVSLSTDRKMCKSTAGEAHAVINFPMSAVRFPRILPVPLLLSCFSLQAARRPEWGQCGVYGGEGRRGRLDRVGSNAAPPLALVHPAFPPSRGLVCLCFSL